MRLEELTDRQKTEAIVAAILYAAENICSQLRFNWDEKRKGGDLDRYEYPDLGESVVEAMRLTDMVCDDSA